MKYFKAARISLDMARAGATCIGVEFGSRLIRPYRVLILPWLDQSNRFFDFSLYKGLFRENPGFCPVLSWVCSRGVWK